MTRRYSMVSFSTFAFLPTAIVLAVMMGCQPESRRDSWGFEPSDTSLDGALGDDGGDTDEPSDASDAADTEGSNPIPRPVIIPEKPVANSGWVGLEWRWIHPAPFPHDILELEEEEGSLRGLGLSKELFGYAPFTRYSSERLRIADVFRIRNEIEWTDVTLSNDGLLGVTETGRIYSGLLQSDLVEEVSGSGYRRISGASSERFIAFQEGGGAYVYHDDFKSLYDDLPGIDELVRMWPNGEIWFIPTTSDSVPGNFSEWTELRRPTGLPDSSTGVYGPRANSTCEPKVVGYFESAGFFMWADRSTAPQSLSVQDHPVREVVCAWDDHILAVGDDGRYLEVDSDGGRWNQAGPYDLNAGRTIDDTTYLGGEWGALYAVSSEGLRVLHSGFRIPNPRPKSAEDKRFTSMWIDKSESEVAFTYSGGASHGSDEGWRQTPVPDSGDGQEFVNPDSAEIWGVDEPMFAATTNHLFRWDNGPDGPRWISTSIGNPGGASESVVDLAGTATDNVWLATTGSLFRFDGEVWKEVEVSGSQEDISLSITGLAFNAQDQLVILNDDQVLKLDTTSGGWTASILFRPECDDLTAYHRSEDGVVYVAGDGPCLARRENGGWSKRELTDDPDRIEAWNFARQPGDKPLLLATDTGLYTVSTNGFRLEVNLPTVGVRYLPEHDAVWALTPSGVVARYYE